MQYHRKKDQKKQMKKYHKKKLRENLKTRTKSGSCRNRKNKCQGCEPGTDTRWNRAHSTLYTFSAGAG